MFHSADVKSWFKCNCAEKYSKEYKGEHASIKVILDIFALYFGSILF